MRENEIFKKLEKHRKFWERREVKRPLIGMQVGSYEAVKDFEAGTALAKKDGYLTSEHIHPERFLPDYDRLYKKHRQLSHDIFWVATPFPGFSWMEAFVGCKIRGTGDSFWAEPLLEDSFELDEVTLDENNPWIWKFVEFLRVLVDRSEGRYPVGQPILRGLTDMLGTIRGQSQFVVDLYKHPEKMRNLVHKLTEGYLKVVQIIHNNIPDYLGGRSIGSVYHLWTPGKCIYFQEDLAALLSPKLYHKYFYEANGELSQAYEYSLLHLHPSSSFIFDEVLKIDSLKVIEVNRDIGNGKTLKNLLPFFKRTLERKCLAIRGELTCEELDLLLSSLPYKGLYLQLVVDTVEKGNHLSQYIREKCKGQKGV